MAVLIDASILIEAERGRLELESHVVQRQDEEFFLSVITASELLHGVHRAVQPEVRTKRSAFVEGILARNSEALYPQMGCAVYIRCLCTEGMTAWTNGHRRGSSGDPLRFAGHPPGSVPWAVAPAPRLRAARQRAQCAKR